MALQKTKRASRLARYAAYVIDALILLSITTFLRVLKIPFLGLIVIYGYNWISTSVYGQTLGKKLFGLRVISTDNSKVSWGKAFLREVIGKIISAFVFALGFIWILFDEKRQGWHDKIAGTVVVQEEELKGGKKVVAFILALILPILAIIGILFAILVFAINPAAQIQKAREVQRQTQLRQQLEEQLQNQSPTY